MKNLVSLFTLILLSIFTFKASAQSQDTVLIVNGVCGMCERVIEKAAQIDGVSLADWNQDTKVLKLSYNPELASLTAISKAVAASGYDTEYITADDKAYNGLHECCKYRDPAILKDHEPKAKAK